MNNPDHPGLRFRIGDMVIPAKRFYPVMLRSDPYEWLCDWETCPSWSNGTAGVIIDIKIDMKSIGEVMIKIVTSTGTGWTDWWNLRKSHDHFDI
jgi:hypothetical protein